MNEERKQHDIADEQELLSRREYLISLKKWSKVVIGAALLGAAEVGTGQDAEARSAWVNNRGNWGNGWKNSGGGSAWVNNRGGGLWGNGSGGWRNGSGSWRNGSGGWNDRGGSWRNGSGGWNDRGGNWRNGSGGGNWVNRRY